MRIGDYMKKILIGLLILFAAVSDGCAEKTESEKLQDEINKASRQMERDMKKAGDEIKREAEAWKS